MPNRIYRVASDALQLINKNTVPLLYFSKVTNVGDLVSVYLVEKISGRKVVKANSRLFPHLSAVGSTIGSCASTSYIWGSGSIDGKPPRQKLNESRIFALRGHGTLELLRKETGARLEIPMGDPAILMPSYYDKPQELKYKIGIVPHFEEYKKLESLLQSESPEICLIDVRQEPEAFIDQLRSCSCILSSSLHGLILADSYGIPNLWISATDLVLGSGWKFLDYYSTTDKPDQSPLLILDSDGLHSVLEQTSQHASTKSFQGSLHNLLNCFPERFIDRTLNDRQ